MLFCRAATPVADTRSFDAQPAETQIVHTESLATIMLDQESDDDQQQQGPGSIQQRAQAPAAVQLKTQKKSKPTRSFAGQSCYAYCAFNLCIDLTAMSPLPCRITMCILALMPCVH